MDRQQAGEKPQASEGQNELNVLALTTQLKNEKEARRAAQGRLADMEAKLQAFEGIDPAAIREIIAEKERLAEEMRKKDPAKLEEHFKAEKQRLIDTYESKLKAALEENAKLKAQNKSLTVTDKVMASIGKYFNDDVLDIVKTVVERHCDLDEAGQIVIRDENGEEMPSPKNRMLPISIEEFGQWLVEKRPSLAKPIGMGGTASASQGERAKRGANGRIPATYAELQAMPNAKEIWANLSYEEKSKLASTMRFG